MVSVTQNDMTKQHSDETKQHSDETKQHFNETKQHSDEIKQHSGDTKLQSTLVISTLLISNNSLSQSENLVPVLT